MSTPKKPRRRALRLKPEALALLEPAMVEYQKQRTPGMRLTWEYRANALDFSVVTTKRVFSNAGVDRATLTHVFQTLGLQWDDSLCIPEFPESDLPLVAEPTRWWNRRKTYFACGSGAFISCSVLLYVFFFSTPRWIYEFNAAFNEGMEKFHAGKYAEVHAPLDRALLIAGEHDSAGSLSSAHRLAGDLASAEGDLPKAIGSYSQALRYREDLKQDQARPAILEALGDVQTRVKDVHGATKSLNEALAGYRSSDDRMGIAMATRDLGVLALQTGELKSADMRLESSLDAIKGMSKPDFVSDVRGQQALVLLKRGKASEAREILQECLAYWTAKNHGRRVATCQLNLGLAEEQLKNLAAAQAYVSRSKRGFDEVGDKAGSIEAAGQLHRLAMRREVASRGPRDGSSLGLVARFSGPDTLRSIGTNRP